MGERYDHWIAGKAEPPATGGLRPDHRSNDPAARRRGGSRHGGRRRAGHRGGAAGPAGLGPAVGRGALRGRSTRSLMPSIPTPMSSSTSSGRAPARSPAKPGSRSRCRRPTSATTPVSCAPTTGERSTRAPATYTYTRLEPYGVVAVITPWNFPLNQACRGAAPALAAGNAVVVKPSEVTSPSTLHLARLATEAGLPDGLLNVVTGTGPDVGAPLAAHPAVGRVSFTGSVATGRLLASIAAERLVPMTLELGGKSPLVAFADADLDRVVAACVCGGGERTPARCARRRLACSSRPSVHDEVVARVVEGVERLEPGIDFGPIITEAQFHKVLDHFATARRPRAPCRRPVARRTTEGPAADRQVRAADRLRRRATGPTHRAGGDLRPGPGRRALRRRGGGSGARQRHRVRPRWPACGAATSPAGCGWPSRSMPAR